MRNNEVLHEVEKEDPDTSVILLIQRSSRWTEQRPVHVPMAALSLLFFVAMHAVLCPNARREVRCAAPSLPAFFDFRRFVVEDFASSTSACQGRVVRWQRPPHTLAPHIIPVHTARRVILSTTVERDPGVVILHTRLIPLHVICLLTEEYS